MKLRENLSTPPFLDQPPFSFLPRFYRYFRPPPPLSVNFGKLKPPFFEGGRSYDDLIKVGLKYFSVFGNLCILQFPAGSLDAEHLFYLNLVGR